MFWGDRLSSYGKALYWIADHLGLDVNRDLRPILDEIWEIGTIALYSERVYDNGRKKRVLHLPNSELRLIQDRLDHHLLNTLDPHPDSFGAFGGSVHQVAKRHTKRGIYSTFMCDFKNAFPSVHFGKVWSGLRKAGLGWRAAEIVALLCTIRAQSSWGGWDTSLPQGAPTSPKLFSLGCYDLDEQLSKLAARVGGVYSRYADNIYFSMCEELFPEKVKKIILIEITSRGFTTHKIRAVGNARPFRLLGLNSRNGEVHNSREFKRRLRKALNHLEYVLDHDLEFDYASSLLNGLLGFTVSETFPSQFVPQLESCRAKLATRLP